MKISIHSQQSCSNYIIHAHLAFLSFINPIEYFYLFLGYMMAVKEAFLATQNCYFNYEFEELNLVDDFPEELSVSLRGMMYRHEIQYPNVTYYIYYSELLTNCELQRLKDDWVKYCPLPE